MATDISSLDQTGTILLTTYKRDGTAVRNPVSVAVDGGRAFFRSYDKAWKTKRLARNPHIDAAPSTLRGKPIGPPVHGTVALLSGEDERIAANALARRHRVLQGVVVPLTHRLLGYRTMHYELYA
jgi:PPOX class probable F420-dependent enzyme